MPCEHVKLSGGGNAIVCTTSRRQKCMACGKPANLLCDWKVPTRRSGTCDKPICEACTHSPAPDKDLCPVHAEVWRGRAASA
jgi:hypothetical protein